MQFLFCKVLYFAGHRMYDFEHRICDLFSAGDEIQYCTSQIMHFTEYGSRITPASQASDKPSPRDMTLWCNMSLGLQTMWKYQRHKSARICSSRKAALRGSKSFKPSARIQAQQILSKNCSDVSYAINADYFSKQATVRDCLFGV